MRSLMCVLFLVIFCSKQGTSYPVAPAAPVWCCFDFIDFQIPAKKIVSAVETDSRCPIPAIVVMTPRTQFCVKPDEAWIKNAMLEQLWK
ncbi:C-C motif chemokine 8-like [Sinocyclocheilus grahami]|uniref:C-C motif chemokine 8-like n=1 Tax=Sinocyclocheilus grahami TaxID=75366 RepID=A0A672LEV2_SINGR|nr:PREDICTED: C-C motif chemokine 8-like [Sinocyclocheilus grahami]